MAPPNSKKRLVQIPAPSASSSSEEQQDSSGSGSSSSSSSSEEEQQQPPQPVTLKPHQQQQDEDEDDSAEDDDEETEESDEPEKLALENPSLKKPQSESESKEGEESDSDDEESDSDDEAIKSPMVSDFTLKPRVPNSAKRAAAAENSGPSSKNKKAKVSNGGDGQIVRSPDEAKKSFSRVWSGDDEIRLLEGIIAYKAKNGSDSITNLGPFHETVKDLNLSLDVTRTRLYEKLRALKKKYLNNVAKKGDIVFSKPHELELYKLSEIFWGGEEGGLNEESGSKVKSPDKKSNKAANVSVKKPVENKDMVKKLVENKDMVKTDRVSDEIKDDALDVGSLFPRLAASIELEASTYLPGMSINSKDFTKEMVLKLGKEKAIELEEEWNDYTEMEHRLFAERLQMIHKHAEAFLDVMKH